MSRPAHQPARLRQLTLLPALLAWLLLALQVPWHTGMAASLALADNRTQLAAALGLRCGPLPDAGTLTRLLEARTTTLEAGSQPPDSSHSDVPCDLFTGLGAAVTAAATAAASVAPTAPVLPAVTARFLATPAQALPPARGPPAIS